MQTTTPLEWSGGAVNASNLIAYKGIDDDFDTDNGFSGKVQFGLGIRDSNIADQSGSNGFECVTMMRMVHQIHPLLCPVFKHDDHWRWASRNHH